MIIGISGRQFSGKGYLCSVIQNEGTRTWEEAKFADNVKYIAALLTKDKEQWSQDGKRRLNFLDISNGRLQQLVGESLRQSVDPLIWVKSLFLDYDRKCNWIITDLRYKNEADYLRSLQKETDVILIRINASYPTYEELVESSGRDRNHKSETDLDDYKEFDYIIDNDSTWQEFLEKCRNLKIQLSL